MISAWARTGRFDEERPAKTWSEAFSRKNEEYQIADKASSAYESAKTGISSFWTNMTAAEERKDGAPTDAQVAAQREQQ